MRWKISSSNQQLSDIRGTGNSSPSLSLKEREIYEVGKTDRIRKEVCRGKP